LVQRLEDRHRLDPLLVCQDLPEYLASAPAPVPEGLIRPQAEALIAASGADFRLGGDRAFYSPSHDFVQVPRPEAFFEPINFHRTALHELGHWTGHPSRLARDLSGSFGSKSYGQEELCAEMASAFVCASLGIVPTVRHADYLGAWLDILREDNRAVIRAASAASKAADYLLAFLPQEAATEPVAATGCESAWNKDPVFGVIGIQSGPRGRRDQIGFHGGHGSRWGDAGSGDNRKDPASFFRPAEGGQGDLP
jgi:antirestriction protein ArdC